MAATRPATADDFIDLTAAEPFAEPAPVRRRASRASAGLGGGVDTRDTPANTAADTFADPTSPSAAPKSRSNGSARTSQSQPSRLSARLSSVLRESRWLVHLVLFLFVALALFTYNKADPAWSHASGTLVTNSAGRIGAWLADVLKYLFGFSAYWWLALFGYFVFAGYRRLSRLMAARSLQLPEDDETLLDRRSAIALWVGFGLTLVSSAAIEAVRFHSSKVPLPFQPGGLVGLGVGEGLQSVAGFTGATLLLLLALAVGWSLFTGMSWLGLAEKVGQGVEWLVEFAKRKREERQDRKAGEAAMEVREQVVEVERRELFDDHSTIRIEPQVVDIPVSKRVEKERIAEAQPTLFKEIPATPLPPVRLLDPAAAQQETVSAETVEFTSRLIEKKLKDFGVSVEVKAAYPGPVITRYEIEPATGVKGSQIVNLARDLARALSLVSVRVVETIPGKNLMGLELPNPKRQVVRLSEIVSSQVYNDMASPLTIAMGKDIAGKPVVADLAKMPHVLVAGTTGSGKSVAINAMILSLLFKAEANAIRLILIDPKMLEMSVYADIPHLLAPVVTDMAKAGNALNWCVEEMEKRYRLMSALGVRNMGGYNTKVAEAKKAGKPLTNPFTLTPESPEPLEHMPYIVVVIDELADLMMVVGKKIEELIARLAQKARAAGIHLVLATQRPSVDVITGLIKANVPTRVAFQVSSKIDSRTILDQMGAESLLGMGDMLYLPPGTGFPMRVHGAFVDDHEVHAVVEHLKATGPANYVEGILDGTGILDEPGDAAAGGGNNGEKDPMYDQAVEIVLKNRKASISLVQRHLRIGYNRAARLLEAMEQAGMVSAMQSNGNREILVRKDAAE
jgi:DNA segregation ATPase FtsK/SpoIIIE, S-DNA-T family